MPLHSEFLKNIRLSADFARQKMGEEPLAAIILGSGLSSYADSAFSDRQEIDYKDIPNFPVPTVSGHRGKLYYGHIHGKMCVCFAGRFHSYEGHPASVITLLPQFAFALGCKIYILTNAAGGTMKGVMKSGCLMSITDHATTSRFNSLYGFEAINAKHVQLTEDDIVKGAEESAYPFTISSKDIYSKQMIELADKVAKDLELSTKPQFKLNGEDRTVELHKSTYLFNSGPNYEYHAMVNEFAELCPGSVGMSSVPEALAARMLGMHVYGLSVITNLGAGMSDEQLTHEDVKIVGNLMSTFVQKLIDEIINQLDISKMEKIQPWGTVHDDFEMIQKQSRNATWEEIEKYKFDGVKRCIIYSDSVFGITQSKQSIIVSCPKTIGEYEASLVLGVCQNNGVTDIKVLDKTLPKDVFISASNIVNCTGEHVVLPMKAEHQLKKVDGDRMLIVDSLEDPRTNVYYSNFAKKQGIKYSTNQCSALFAIIGRLVGQEVIYCHPSQALKDMPHEQVKRWEMNCEEPKFGVFNVHQVTYEEAQQEYEKYFKNLDIQKVICFDTIAFKQFLKEGQKLIEGSKIEAVYNQQAKTLFVHMPQLSDNIGLTETAIAARVLKFVAKPVLVITGDCNCTEPKVVEDVIEFSGLDPLRGENDERFGARFPDVSQVCNKDIAEKLGYKKGVFYLILDAKYDGQQDNVVCGGALQNVMTLLHQQTPMCAVVAPANKIQEVVKKYLE